MDVFIHQKGWLNTKYSKTLLVWKYSNRYTQRRFTSLKQADGFLICSSMAHLTQACRIFVL